MHRVCRRRTDRRRMIRRKIRTKNNMITNDISVCSNSRPTVVSDTPSSSSSRIVDAQCALERQTSRRTTTRFFVDDILRPDFGVRHRTWRPNDFVRLDASLCSLSIEPDHSTTSSTSWSSSAPTTCHSNSPVQPTMTASTAASATLRDEATGRKTTAMDNSRNSLNVETLPAWIFCTRYSDRPSSGTDSSQLAYM